MQRRSTPGRASAQKRSFSSRPGQFHNPSGKRSYSKPPATEGNYPSGESPKSRYSGKPNRGSGAEKRTFHSKTKRNFSSGISTGSQDAGPFSPRSRPPRPHRNDTDRPFKKKLVLKKTEDTSVRINKYIASTGLCSRREADEMIKQGLITLNGQVVTELGIKITPYDDIRYNGERLHEEKKVYLLLNKPKDYTTTTDDPHAKKTVMELVKGACRERIFPVGRLDRTTTGVLLFTNDGDLARKLMHPKFNKKKVYHIFLDKKLRNEDFRKIANGLNLEDGFIQPDSISWVDENDKSQLGMEIHSGRNRIVRRIFEFLGYHVRKLDRVYYAGLTKKGLERGHWRLLTEKEIRMLQMGAYE